MPNLIANETRCLDPRCCGLMTVKSNEDAAGTIPMERRIIQVENLRDQAGIAAALRRAFVERSEPARCGDADDDFAALLKQIN